MRFSDIIGLEEVKHKLVKSYGRNHHAQVFNGPPGSSNLAMALAYTSFINCESPLENDSCGNCPSCQKIDKLIHPDVHFIFPVSATTKWKGKDVVSTNFLSEWRNFLLKVTHPTLSDWLAFYGAENKQANISKEESRQIVQKLTLKSFEAKYKTMIIWLPEWMHPSSANAILKILEEPPGETIFLLVTNDYERLLTTIVSRTQLVNIRANTQEEAVQHLIKACGIDEEKAQNVAYMSQGDMSLAIRLATESDLQENSLFSQWMRYCWQNDYSQLVNMAEHYHSMDKLSQKNLLSFGLTTLRGALMSGQGIKQLARPTNDDKDFIEKFGKVVSIEKIEKINTEISEAFYHLERNASAKMTHLDLSLKIGEILKARA